MSEEHKKSAKTKVEAHSKEFESWAKELPDFFYAHAASSKHTAKSKVHFKKTCPSLVVMFDKAGGSEFVVVEDVGENGTIVSEDNSCQRCKRAEGKTETT